MLHDKEVRDFQGLHRAKLHKLSDGKIRIRPRSVTLAGSKGSSGWARHPPLPVLDRPIIPVTQQAEAIGLRCVGAASVDQM